MDEMPGETVLIVDDEESVRRTFREWLAGQGCDILTAGDAESALNLANQHPIDLAILDWNLGAGDDGLQLLQDLVVFQPDVVAILVTGYANQATPLDAMRMGVRDYLDKNHDLNREAFLKAVRKQLERIRPAKHARQLQRSLQEFRAAVEKTLPLVQSAAALTDPVPLPDSVRKLVRLAVQLTRAKDGILLVRHYDAVRTPAEWSKAYDAAGAEVAAGDTPFARSLAGAAVSRQEACVMDLGDAPGVVLYPFERGRGSVLVAPMLIATGVQAVLELFDKPGGFASDDARLAQAAADLGTELIRHALGASSQQQMLFDALAAALDASERITRTLGGDAPRSEEPPPAQVLDRLRQGLASAAGDPVTAQANIELAEAIRVLGVKHGPPALRHCLRLVENLRELLDGITG